jgi:hypothetical protein
LSIADIAFRGRLVVVTWRVGLMIDDITILAVGRARFDTHAHGTFNGCSGTGAETIAGVGFGGGVFVVAADGWNFESDDAVRAIRDAGRFALARRAFVGRALADTHAVTGIVFGVGIVVVTGGLGRPIVHIAIHTVGGWEGLTGSRFTAIRTSLANPGPVTDVVLGAGLPIIAKGSLGFVGDVTVDAIDLGVEDAWVFGADDRLAFAYAIGRAGIPAGAQVLVIALGAVLNGIFTAVHTQAAILGAGIVIVTGNIVCFAITVVVDAVTDLFVGKGGVAVA